MLGKYKGASWRSLHKRGQVASSGSPGKKEHFGVASTAQVNDPR